MLPIPQFATIILLASACASSRDRPADQDLAHVTPPTDTVTEAPAQASNRYPKLGVQMKGGGPDLSRVAVELTRSECFGSCPSYSIVLHGTGQAEYTGRAFVVNKGHTYFEFAAARIAPILDEFERLDFMRLHHDCPMTGVDMPFTTLELTINGKTATLTSPWTDGQIPEQLNADDAALHRAISGIANAIDTAGDRYRWIGTESERQFIER